MKILFIKNGFLGTEHNITNIFSKIDDNISLDVAQSMNLSDDDYESMRVEEI